MGNSEACSVLVIIPAYNEAAVIGSVIDGVRREVPFAELVVIDDGSTDETASICRARKSPLISLPFNLGIGGAMQTGYRYAFERGFDVAIQVDGDGQHPPEEIDSLLKALLDGKADMVIGSRFIGVRQYEPTIPRRLGAMIFSVVISAITRQRMTDTTCGFRAVNRRVIEYFARHYPCDYPEVEALVYLHRIGCRLREIPIRVNQRMAGKSSITWTRASYYMVKVLLAVFVDLFKGKQAFRGKVL